MSLKKLKKQGFTLIELMIVVAIIGILAAIAVPKFADMVTKSKEAAVKGNLGAVRSATSIYYGDMEGQYPENLHDGLTTADKYMPAANGLGNFTLPTTTNNTGGHTSSPTNATKVTQGAAPTDGNGIYYINQGSRLGEVYVNCSHKDTKGTLWTAY
jgi:prepilin-type N-terminal cleavage/methylation domain-containing protein